MNELATLEVSHDGGVVVARVTGEIDLSNAADLERAIADAVPNGAGGLVIDLSGLGYLDSSGVRLLLSLAGRLRWRRVLSMAGVDGSVVVETDVERAAARVHEEQDASR